MYLTTDDLSLNETTEITVLLGMVAHAFYPAFRRLGLENSPAGGKSEILLKKRKRKKASIIIIFPYVSPQLDCEFFCVQ